MPWEAVGSEDPRVSETSKQESGACQSRALGLMAAVGCETGSGEGGGGGGGQTLEGRTEEQWAQLLEDRDRGTRLKALWALDQLGARRRDTLKSLARVVENEKEEELVARAINNIGGMGKAARDEVSLLETCVRSPQRSVSRAALYSITALAPYASKAVPTVVEYLTDPARHDQDAATNALAAIGEPAIPALVAVIGNDAYDDYTRRCAVEAIHWMLTERDRIGEIYERAGGRAPDRAPNASEAIPALVSVLNGREHHERHRKAGVENWSGACGLCSETIETLVELGPAARAECEVTVRQMLDDPDWAARRAAEDAVKAWSGP